MNGRKRQLLTSLLISGVILLSGSLRAQADSSLVSNLSVSDVLEQVQATAEVVFLNHYVWRGIRFTDGAVAQPSLTLGGGNFSFNAWANLDLNDVNSLKHQVNELDFTLNYSLQFKSLSLSAGLIEYTFPNTRLNSTTEIFWSVSAAELFRPSITVYRDIDEADGLYLSLGFGHSVPLDAIETSLEFSGALGWGSAKHNSFYYGIRQNGGTGISFGIGAPFDLFRKMTVIPRFGYTGLLAGNIRKSAGKKDHFTAGVSITSSYTYPEL